MPISSSPTGFRFLECSDREGYAYTHPAVPKRPAKFVRRSKVIFRQHAHRESDPFLRDKKERVNPQVPEPSRTLLPQKSECKSFLIRITFFFYNFPYGRVLDLSANSPFTHTTRMPPLAISCVDSDAWNFFQG
jgi:hypothetical protein